MLTGQEIIKRHALGQITIEPFDESQVSPNSYDVRIGDRIACVMPNVCPDEWTIDTSLKSVVCDLQLNDDGNFELQPGFAYLAHTVETIGSDYYVPVYHGRSSTARHGLMTHYAGLGDLGWKGQLVLELVNMTGYPMLIRPGVRVGQVSWHEVTGEIRLYNSTYMNQSGIVAAKGLT